MPNTTARIRGEVREMAAATVSQLIGISQMNAITANDPNPYFFEAVIAHEGESKGEIVGFGAKLKTWSKRVIRAVANAFNPAGRVPAKIYDGFYNWHGNQDSRLPVGDVVHSAVAELNGVESVQTIGYIYSSEAALRTALANGDRDCCSLEGDALFVQDNGKLIVTEFERGRAIVLGHRSKQLPGFPGAIVRSLAEFGPEDAGGENPPAPPVPPATPPPVAPPQVELTKEQVVEGARSLGLGASDFGFASAPPAPIQLPPSSLVTIPAPPAQPTKPEAKVDLRDPKNNQFL